MQRPWGGQAWVTWKSEPTATLAEELRVRQTIWGLGMGMARIWEASGSDGPSVVLPLLKRVGRDLSSLLLQEVPPTSPTFSKRKRSLVFHGGLWQLPAICPCIPAWLFYPRHRMKHGSDSWLQIQTLPTAVWL